MAAVVTIRIRMIIKEGTKKKNTRQQRSMSARNRQFCQKNCLTDLRDVNKLRREEAADVGGEQLSQLGRKSSEMAELLPEQGGYLGLSMGWVGAGSPFFQPNQTQNCDQTIYSTQTQPNI